MEINIKVTDNEVIVNGTKVKISKDKSYSQYARMFDHNSKYYYGDAEADLMFLKHQQNYANDLLKAKGHLFLNDVYDMLGIPRSKAGQLVGWVYNSDDIIGDNFIDFGIPEINLDIMSEGTKILFMLDFNVDGEILDRAFKE